MSGPRTAVVTLAQGRHDHLAGQLRGLAAGTVAPDLHVVAAMADPDIAHVVAAADSPWQSAVVDVDVAPDGQLPLAAARNRAVEVALERGCELVVLLDVDCIPSGGLLERYVWAHLARPSRALLCGEVRYLPPAPGGAAWPLDQVAAAGRPHPARPRPAGGQLLPAEDLMLFWSLSFAVSADTWRAVGGFDEAYNGYGGEDTDFAMRAQRAGCRMWWVGGAEAYHQHHPTRTPPTQHLDAVVRNANLFRTRWGWFPMQGWLDEFERLGLAREDPARQQWVTEPATAQTQASTAAANSSVSAAADHGTGRATRR